MTATRMPALACDWDRCHMHLWADPTTTIPALRARAIAHGWLRFDRRDWCPTHAAQLGVTTTGSST